MGAAGRARPARTMLVTILLGGLAAAGGCATAGALFGTPEPEIIWTGTAPGVPAGVIVIRDEGTLAEATEPLVPDVGGAAPDLDRRTILRVVARSLAESCGTTGVAEISTSGTRATVVLQEQLPPAGCRCKGSALPAAWLVSVSRAVRRAEAVTNRVEVPCDAARAAAAASGPELVLEGSWDEEPGAKIVADRGAYDALLGRLGVAGRGPEVDFASHVVVAVTGRPRSNGCRRTLAVDAALEGTAGLVVTLEETYPRPGTVCTQIFRLPKVFLYRVPMGVRSARVVTNELR